MGKINKKSTKNTTDLSISLSGETTKSRRKSLVIKSPETLPLGKRKKPSELKTTKIQDSNYSKITKRSGIKKSELKATKAKILKSLKNEYFQPAKSSSKATKDDSVTGTFNKYNMNVGDIKRAVKGIIKFHADNPKIKNQLFDECFPLFLQVNCHKLPLGNPKLFRIPLKNCVLKPDDEICLIVSEVKGIGNKEHEKHVEHYENLLKTKGVTNINKIMTMHELTTEHETFEQKQRLVDLYDAFLVCGKISGKVVKKCGKIFYKKRKLPIPVKLQSSNLKEHIDKALAKAFFHVHLKGDSYNVQFGHNQMEVQQLVENICSVVEFLNGNFPGGFNNIKGLHVFAPRTTSIPIYWSTDVPQGNEKIKMKSQKPKHFKTLKGELTTLPNTNVIVRPTGEVIVEKIQTKDESAHEKITDEDIIRVNKEDNENTKKSNPKKGKQKRDTEISESKVAKKQKIVKRKDSAKVSPKVEKTKKKVNLEKKIKITLEKKNKSKKMKKPQKKVL